MYAPNKQTLSEKKTKKCWTQLIAVKFWLEGKIKYIYVCTRGAGRKHGIRLPKFLYVVHVHVYMHYFSSISFI